MHVHRKLLKKGMLGWQYIVGLVLSLIIIGVLIYILMRSQGGMMGIIDQIKGLI